MNTMIQKYVTQGFMTEAEGNYIDEAIDKKESIIVSGHRSAGIRPLMATLMAVAKGKFKSIQVKGFEDLNKDVEYFLIPGLDNLDFEKLIGEAMAKPNTSFISLKEPEHPYSILKLLRQVYKETEDTSKVYHLIECAKIDNVPKLTKITKMHLEEKGKIIKVDFEG
ncbi:hypothetical protein [Tissierella praeacuta]|uniref:hypothetical protein n=1 Tax=Tissierella praeacuta TaxID=43131 RepID=UPI0028AFC559|nr:hypothetical protein [Tissierella praeacuta]